MQMCIIKTMPKNNRPSSLSVLSLALGVFLIIAGIYGLAGEKSFLSEIEQGLNKLFGNNDRYVISVVISIMELIAGTLMLLAPFGLLQSGVLKVSVLIVCAFWLAKIILELFVYRDVFQNSYHQKDVLGWLQDASLNLVILVAMWQIRHLD